jgi:PAS domain S-box-containing protein
MVDSPQTMLQKVVEAALDLCVADSAGVSILDPRSATGTFRWHAVTGQLSAEVGRQIPGNASPCRTVLNENKPLLFTYPERHFDYGAEIHLPIVEALLVPFEAKEKLEGTLWVISHSPSRQFDIEDRRVLTSLSRFVCAAFEIKMAAMAAEAQRKAVADEIRQTWDTSATALTRCSSDLRYLWVNPAYAKLVGLPADHIIGRPMADVMGPQVLELIRPRLERVLRGERVEYEEEVPFASGGFRFLHVVSTPWTNAAGRVDGWLSSVSDITELRQTTLRLQEREARLRLALDASRGGSWSWDAHSNRADWDDRFRELYGFTAERPPSRGAWLRRVYEEDRQWVLASLDEILRTKTRDSWDNTFRIVRPDGTVAWIESRGQAYRDSEGELIRLTGLDLDVTERRRAEEALRESKEREAFLLRLTDTLRPLGDPLAIQEVTTRMLGEYLHVNRCNCGDIEGSDFIVRRSYANGVAPWIPGGPVATFGQSLIKAHRRGEPVVVNDVRSDPRLNDSERETLLGYEIAAFAGVMLLKDGQWVAVLAVHSATPRAWTKD